MSEFINGDCMDYLKQYEDNHFDLAIVDPPYGDGNMEEGYGSAKRFGGKGSRFEMYKNIDRRGGQWANKYGSNIIEWDKAPSKAYFDELFRVSKNQIIWGGNYFELPKTRCFLVWVKTNIPEDFSMAMCEYAWTSFKDNAKVFYYSSLRNKEAEHFHPTEKPINLYEWILSRYAKDGDLILDTHVGSGTSIIACDNCGFDYVGFEINETYYTKAKERIDLYKSQMRF